MTTEAARDANGPAGSAPGSKGLKGNALGLVSSVVIGLSSTAPAYSLAASLGLVVVLAGDKSPGIMVLAFIPMYLIAVAYRELNKAEPDCGTTFTWAGRAFGPWVGWLGGWGIIAADVIVMANLAQIAGSYTFQLFGAEDLAGDKLWSTVAGVVWIVLMTYICYRGIEVSARLQYALLGIELAVLAAFAIVAFVKVYSGNAPDTATIPSLAWLWPSGMSVTDIVDAVLIAVFLYWGWDTAVACNEESDDPGRTPGRAAVISTLLLVATNVLVTAAAVAFAGTGTTGIGLGNPDNASDIFAAIGPAIFGDSGFGKVFSILLIISVLTSSAACTQTTILPTARAALSMGAYRAIPTRFANIHPRYLTPSYATWAMGIVSIIFYVGLTFLSSNVLSDSIAAVGLLIAFYYGLTGFACVWYYRHHLRGKDLWTKGVLPGLGALLLLGAFIISAKNYLTAETDTVFGSGGLGVFLIGIGSLVLGGVLMVGYSRVAPAFFRGETLTPGHHDLLLGPEGSVARVGLPDSGDMPTVIAPDLSNLPPGQKPYDPS
ncbi:APC family permease [Pseudonocardia sp. GCM10023141]|uniref:APC family permease n=1 Tax=Pseudonocardia sp. GCM10023141 TaxID=3252653 RepID=UPI003623D43B